MVALSYFVQMFLIHFQWLLPNANETIYCLNWPRIHSLGYGTLWMVKSVFVVPFFPSSVVVSNSKTQSQTYLYLIHSIVFATILCKNLTVCLSLLTCKWFGASVIVWMYLLTLVQFSSTILWHCWRMVVAITHDDRIKNVCMICVRWQVTNNDFPLILITIRSHTNHILLKLYMLVYIEILGVQFQKREHIFLWYVGFLLIRNWKIWIAHYFFW